MRGPRQAHSAGPECLRSGLRSGTRAQPNGPGGVPSCDFKTLKQTVKKRHDISKKNRDISQNDVISQKNVVICIIVTIFSGPVFYFFFYFRHRFQICRGSSAAFGWARVPPTIPGKFKTDGESQKKNISLEKKNITKNENIIQRKHQYPYNILQFFVGVFFN